MNSLTVFIVVFGGAGLLVGVFVLLKTFISPRKLETIERMIQEGNIKSAMRHAKILLARNERNPDAHWYLGECYRYQKRPDLAIAEYQYVTSTGKFTNTATERRVRERLAEEYLKQGQIDESQKEYILLCKIEPNNYEYFYQVARLFEQRNYTDSALTNYKKAISLNPGHAPSYRELGVIFYKKRMIAEARKALRTALKYDPQSYSCYYYLGMISKSTGDTKGAMSYFEKAMNDPTFRQKALYERANIYISKGDLAHAIYDLERAIKADKEEGPATLAIRYLLAKCYESNKQLLKAVEQWEEIYKKNPKYRDVAEKLVLYSDMRSDDKLKDFLIAPQSKFQEYCKKIVESLGLGMQDVFMKNQDLVEITALETQSRWRNAKKAPSVVRIFRSADPIGYDVIRSLYDQMKKTNATRSICITASRFTRSAIEFAQIRPIDLIDKEELTKILHTL